MSENLSVLKKLSMHTRRNKSISKIDQVYDISEITKDDNDLEMFLKYKKEYDGIIPKGNKKVIQYCDMITDNAIFLEELSDYFILKIDRKYPKYLYQLLAPTAINLIPLIINLRRRYKRYFKMKLFYAGWSKNTYLINYIFISVDENGMYDNFLILERIDGISYILE